MMNGTHKACHDERNAMIIPTLLQIGDTIGVMSPSSYIEEGDLNTAVKMIEARGYKAHVHPQTLSRHHQSAGTHEEKLAAFHDLIKNPDTKAIIFSSGGNRALHWVDQIDFDLVQANPKIIMGFSDITSILNLINAETGLVTFHGPTMRWFVTHADNTDDIEQCFSLLSSPLHTGIRMPAQGGHNDLPVTNLIGGHRLCNI